MLDGGPQGPELDTPVVKCALNGVIDEWDVGEQLRVRCVRGAERKQEGKLIQRTKLKPYLKTQRNVKKFKCKSQNKHPAFFEGIRFAHSLLWQNFKNHLTLKYVIIASLWKSWKKKVILIFTQCCKISHECVESLSPTTTVRII